MTNFFENLYFTEKELACPCCGELKLARHFLELLLALRICHGAPFLVTSCCRCEKHNDEVGGVDNSTHLTTGIGTHAIDIALVNTIARAKLIKLALNHGWSVGVYKTFLHLDARALIERKEQVVF